MTIREVIEMFKAIFAIIEVIFSNLFKGEAEGGEETEEEAPVE